MLVREVTVTNKAGLHTRPASMIVRAAARFKSDFYIKKDGYEINGKSIIGVMTLAAEQGAILTLTFEGSDEHQAADEIARIFADGFGEEK
ncbi:MAG: HPr family phosphocarrier protein [Rhodothermales bacterium]|nr:HPr family phosphocarrier protein [Rhodothermales bacterium]